MGRLAMPRAEKPLQAGQTHPVARGAVAATKLLAEEIDTDFCQQPLTERTILSGLPARTRPDHWLPLGLLCSQLRTVHRLTHGQPHGTAFLFQQGPPQQERRQRRLGRGRRRAAQAVLLEQLFDAFEDQLDMPARLIQAQHLLVGPLLAWQGGHQEHPARQVERVGLQLLLMLAGLAPLAPLGCLPLLLTQAQGNPAQGDTSALMADPDLSTTHPTCGGMSSFEPLHYRDPLPSSSSRGRLCGVKRTTRSANCCWTKAMRARRPLARSVTIRSPACSSKTSNCSPTCRSVTFSWVSRPESPIKGRMHPPDHAQRTWTGQMA